MRLFKDINLSELFDDLDVLQINPPASENDIAFVEKNIVGSLPEIYKSFLRRANGIILNNCVLYDTDSIVEMYTANQFKEYAPDYVSIGNDNGDRELIMKAENNAVMCGFLDAGALGTEQPDDWFEFTSFLAGGCEILEDEEDIADKGKICIIKIPTDKMKFMVETKKVFALSISTSELLKGIKTLPFVIVQDVLKAKAQILISQTAFPECYKFFNDVEWKTKNWGVYYEPV